MDWLRKKLWLISTCLVWCFMVFSPQIGWAQDSTIEALKRQLADMQQQMQKMVERIEQLEREKVAQAEPPTPPAQQPVQSILGALNPAITVFGNFVGRGDNKRVVNEDGDRISNKFNLREVEVDMRAPIDPYADGVFISNLES